jgi:aquaporin Z
VGDVSGAHFNPAVTFGFLLARRFPLGSTVPYVAAQCLGGLAASGFLRLLFPENASLGVTVPAGPWAQAFSLELVLTFMLMFVTLSVATGSKEKGVLAGVAIGAVIAFEALFAGPISGASMNPARSFAPAVMSGRLAELWIYLTAPVLGAALAVAAFVGVHGSTRDNKLPKEIPS